jgi:hypothetical protein
MIRCRWRGVRGMVESSETIATAVVANGLQVLNPPW